MADPVNAITSAAELDAPDAAADTVTGEAHGPDCIPAPFGDCINHPPAVPAVDQGLREQVLDATVRSHLDAMHESLGSVPFDEVSDRTKRLIRSQVSGIVDHALAATSGEYERIRESAEGARRVTRLEERKAAAALAREAALRAGVVEVLALIEVEMRKHDRAQVGFSAVGDTYAHAVRIVRALLVEPGGEQ